MEVKIRTAGPATSPPPTPLPPCPPPDYMPASADEYVRQRLEAQEEPAALKGIVYEQHADGTWQVLEAPGDTHPDVPPGGQPDIPASDVKDGRVVISIDGIHQPFDFHRDQIVRFLQASGPLPDHGANVGQNVVGIHEGSGPSDFADGVRIFKDIELTKALQTHLPLSWIDKCAYRVDPAVKSIHDEVRQSLEMGRDVDLVVHSGGGAETALALTILSQEDCGKFASAISDRVRLVGLAPALAVHDFELAGVKTENIYYTGSHHDPVWQLSHEFMHPWLQFMHIPSALHALWMAIHHQGLPYHSPDYIFAHNVLPDGSQRIQQFLNGGPGGNYPLP